MKKEIFKRLISYNTVSCNSNLELIFYCQELLKNSGYRIKLFGTKNKRGLFAYKTEKNRIVLAGHTDTVPATGDWTNPPLVLSENKDNYFGLGVTDMKGFLSIALSIATQPKCSDRIAVLLTYDEETDFAGANKIPEGLINANDIIILGEPTNSRAIFANRGILTYKIKFIGMGGHGSEPDKGISAIESAAKFIQELKRSFDKEKSKLFAVEFEKPYPTLNFGLISGGSAVNKIAEEVTLSLEFRIGQEKDAACLIELVEQAKKEVCSKTQVLECEQIPPFIGSLSLKPYFDNTMIEYKKGCSYTTEAFIMQKFTDKIVIYGPGTLEDAHKTNEKISKKDLIQYEDKLIRLVNLITQVN